MVHIHVAFICIAILWLIMIPIIRRYDFKENVNLPVRLQSSTTAITIRTITDLLHDRRISRFEPDQIFLKSIFKIQIHFSIFPHLENV